MRVLYLINYAGKAGTEKYVENLVAHLHPDRATCFLGYNIDGPLAEKMRRRGVVCFQLEMRHPFDKKAARKLADFCRENEIDVIHAQYPRENYIALLSKKYRPETRVIFTSHLTVDQNAVWRFFNRRMMKKNECVIPVCAEGREILIRNGVPAEKIRVIFNGIDPGGPPPERRLDRSRPALGELVVPEAFVVMIFARLSPEKGLPFLCDAFAAAVEKSPVPLYLCIAGDGDERSVIEEKIAALGLTDRILLLGFRNDTDELLRDADLYVNSSGSGEAMSFAMLEALAAGLPLVATRVGGSPDLVEMGGKCGFVTEYGDTKSFSEAVVALAGDADLCARFSEAARHKAENEFELRHLLDEVFDTYSDKPSDLKGNA